MYLLDANILINAKREFFQFERVPEFWEWLIYQGEIGNIKIPVEVYEEFKDTNSKNGDPDELAEWASREDVKRALLYEEEVDEELVQKVVHEGYVSEPTDEDVIKMGRDPFLIAHALANPKEIIVTSAENSKPRAQGANRKVPDVCKSMGIECINAVELINRLDFRTNWKGLD